LVVWGALLLAVAYRRMTVRYRLTTYRFFHETGLLSRVGNRVGADPLFVDPEELAFTAVPFAGDPSFVTVLIRTGPGDPQGDFHIEAGSPAVDRGVTRFNSIDAPAIDVDGQSRLAGVGPDVGADERAGAPAVLYFSVETDISGGHQNEDVLSWTRGATGSGALVTVLDLSDVGVTNNVDAVHRIDEDSYLLSFSVDTTVPHGVGSVEPEDVLRFDAMSPGAATTGTFSWYFDGSDVDLTTTSTNNNENVDAVSLVGGDLIVSTQGNFSVTGASGSGHDLIRFTPSSGSGLGDDSSAGTWAMYFDGSDVQLTTGGEVLDGAAPQPSADRIFLSTGGGFNVPLTGVSGFALNLTGQDEDVFYCVSYTPETGGSTTCVFASAVFFDGTPTGIGLSANDVDGVDVDVP